MTECANTDVRDMLPDYVAATLDASAAAMVGAHVDACEECRTEVALLQVARRVRPVAAPIDVARIVAALPRPGVSVPERAPTLTVTRGGAPTVSTPPSMAPARARRGVLQGVWRMAAAVTLMAVGGWSVMRMQSGGAVANVDSIALATTEGAAVRMDTAVPVTAVVGASSGSQGAARNGAVRSTATRSTDLMGDLSDFDEEELALMLERLERWDGATSTEPVTLPVVPVDDRGGA